MNAKEFVDHLESVISVLGVYEGKYWDIILMEDGTCRIVGKSNGFEYFSWLNNNSPIYSSLKKLCIDFISLEPDSHNLIKDDWYEIYNMWR